MNKKIVSYILGNKVFTLATVFNENPYCANCFYAFDEQNKLLIFLSDNETRHITEALINNNVAGTINTTVTTVAKIQGIQFTGKFIKPNKEQQESFYTIYYNRFPFAKAKPSLVWGISLSTIKMTDNTLGFGKKILWSRS